jgi:hypothetical protein
MLRRARTAGQGSSIVVLLASVVFLAIDRRDGHRDSRMMLEREFFHLDGRTWFVRVRPDVRRDEADTHLTLELMADQDTRVLSCRREEWYTPDPDFAALVARSVAAGASRHVGPRPSGLPE